MASFPQEVLEAPRPAREQAATETIIRRNNNAVLIVSFGAEEARACMTWRERNPASSTAATESTTMPPPLA